MVRRGEALEGVTAFLATAVAGLLLVVPLSFGRTCHCTPYQVNRLVLSVPREAAIGVLVAAVTAVVAVSLARARRGGSRWRPRWCCRSRTSSKRTAPRRTS
ncbi:hypothetical protein ACRS6B_14560 [Nocardia asteroides]